MSGEIGEIVELCVSKERSICESRVLCTQEACAGERPVVGRSVSCLGRWRLVAARFLGVIGF